jgi:hypothetical protein
MLANLLGTPYRKAIWGSRRVSIYASPVRSIPRDPSLRDAPQDKVYFTPCGHSSEFVTLFDFLPFRGCQPLDLTQVGNAENQ